MFRLRNLLLNLKDCPSHISRCEWFPWNAWSDCSRSCAGGTRKRDRLFCCNAELVHEMRLCMADCNMDYDYHSQFFDESESCNTYCYNGGTYILNGYCSCTNRYKGQCCKDEVKCGRPSSILNGDFSTNDDRYTYNARVTYKCLPRYGLKGNYQRTCTRYGSWSGSSPTCLYAVSCNSSPCKNGATCTNMLGGYKCVCGKGWTGNICDVDIQPPVVMRCPGDRMIITENMTSLQTWHEPVFEDPHGTPVHITKNYQTNSHEFPWGEFYIHFAAVKPSNGYRTECKFKISVKPRPCKDMEPPANGIVVCNNWTTDYTRACVFVCKADYTLPPGSKPDHFYICGATGNWLPSTPVKKCYSKKVFPSNNINTYSTCTEQGDRDSIGKFYIALLKKSGFNSLCEHYPNDCKSENVSIKC
ncbi:sushi, von Willebrand factor type A, EGF and pentraxin domain-containing protein 1-like isoform X2 [Ruditapes philippinarum]|uniref:sushi, von Willebrand factor type A, EGF and pentraxin domain-containing protein 1-like isoform X2 n=1 Tax=Ruditapes philippinarum TaxID=129788 RepID=UPI00295BDCD4|nr:sushi, von Willebrand factor type A, EGF and pentraxin domain-containing protein 1-like isoform X2 [Ruditapes philippinarum]